MKPLSTATLFFVVSAAALACTTETIYRTTPRVEEAVDEPADDDGSDNAATDDAAPEGADERAKPSKPVPKGPTAEDAGADPTPSTPAAPSTPPAPPAQSGGKIRVTCPAEGFHKPDPIEIASLPSSLLPRCSATTRACAYAATTGAEYDACLTADATPAASFGGEDVDCAACDRTQGSYCLASACNGAFATYACCVQANGSAACASALQAVTSCAAGAGKSAFDACVNALVGACFG